MIKSILCVSVFTLVHKQNYMLMQECVKNDLSIFVIFRYSWTENLYGSSSFQSSPPNQSKLETKPPLNLPPAFEESNESFTFYPTSPSASNSSLLEVTDHLGTFRIALCSRSFKM